MCGPVFHLLIIIPLPCDATSTLRNIGPEIYTVSRVAFGCIVPKVGGSRRIRTFPKQIKSLLC